jgi:hypothetical protein
MVIFFFFVLFLERVDQFGTIPDLIIVWNNYIEESVEWFEL